LLQYKQDAILFDLRVGTLLEEEEEDVCDISLLLIRITGICSSANSWFTNKIYLEGDVPPSVCALLGRPVNVLQLCR